MKIVTETATTTDSKIIEATIDLIGELGYKGTTTRQIADRAGVDEVTLFRRFGSKESLAKRAVVLAQTQLRTALDSAGREKTGELRADLAKLALLMMEILGRKRESVLAMLFEAKRVPYFTAATAGMVQFILNLIREFLENYELEKPLQKDDVEIISLSIASFVFYRIIVKERLLEKEFTSKNRKEEVEVYIGFLLRNVTPPRRKSR